MLYKIINGILGLCAVGFVMAIIVFSVSAFGSTAEVESAVHQFGIFEQLIKYTGVLLNVLDVISLVLLGIAIVATVLARLCFKISEAIKKKRLQNKVGKVLGILDRLNSVVLDLIQFFPTFGRNPKSQLLAAELKRLQEASNVKPDQK